MLVSQTSLCGELQNVIVCAIVLVSTCQRGCKRKTQGVD